MSSLAKAVFAAAPPGRLRRLLPPGASWLLFWPSLVILLFFVVPFVLLLRVSVARPGLGAVGAGGIDLQNYTGLAFDAGFIDSVGFSLALASLVAVISLSLSFPFTFWIARMTRRAQVVWLVFLLTTLSLSEVLITFAWQVMLAKRIGLSNLLVWLHLLPEPKSLSPNLGAVVACLVYLVIPFSVLLLFPGMSRIDPQLVEAARTMGASPTRAFFTVIVPLMRQPIVACFLMSFIVAIGSYVAPLVLGRPEHWTVAILISKAALNADNLPLATAMSVAFLAATALVCGIVLSVAGRRVAD
ncbi:MAG: putative spermidine/putrescine transport system permease protein [Gammaproteobacteria bacterium]|jgi:putative spermidine/putrescine transport system permease protein|nr:putative spermidine/putrescine transport system permease protein [Gammaproteobacteria bacterium]